MGKSFTKNEKTALAMASTGKHISEREVPGWAWVKSLKKSGLIKEKKIPRFNAAERKKLSYLYTASELNKMKPKTVYVLTAKGKTAQRNLQKNKRT